jgi:Zn-dependent protease with chaperone function
MKKFIAYATPWGTIRTGSLFEKLTPREQLAVLAHERGHIVHRHAWKRIWWMVTLQVFIREDAYWAMCRAQEFEADQHAVKGGHTTGLAMVLARCPIAQTDSHPSKQERLARLL